MWGREGGRRQRRPGSALKESSRRGQSVSLANLSALFIQFLSLLPLFTRCHGAQTFFFNWLLCYRVDCMRSLSSFPLWSANEGRGGEKLRSR